MEDWQQYIGLAQRAGKIITGEENIINKIRNKHIRLVLVALDASNNTKKKYFDKCAYYNVRCIEYGTIDEISHAIGKRNRVAIGICDVGFAKGLLAKITR